MNPWFAFTDGACAANGRPGAVAGYSAVICTWVLPADAGKTYRAKAIRGGVSPTTYALIDPADPSRGFEPAAAGMPAVAPSNNRGELLGIATALLAILQAGSAGKIGPVEIVSDSDISIKTLLDWYPKRLAKKTTNALKNLDLVEIAWALLGVLRTRAESVTLTHVRSHQRAPAANRPVRERFFHGGNAEADRHAGLAIGAELITDVDDGLTSLAEEFYSHTV